MSMTVSEPTPAQKEAGNYKKDHINFLGLDIAIENKRGSMRRGVGADGEPWQVKMPAAYGYIKRTEGADGDHVDVYVGPHSKCEKVFIVDQFDCETGKFDEHKVMLGFPSMELAKKTYLKAFSDDRGEDRCGAVLAMDMGSFKEWLKAGKAKKSVRGFARGGAVPYASGGQVMSDEDVGIGGSAPMADADLGIEPSAPQKPAAPDIGRGQAFLTGAKQGVTANFADEFAGASGAGLAGLEIPKEARISMMGRALSVPVGIARMLYEKYYGGDEAGKAYDTERDRVREETKQAQEQYPGTYLAGNVAGAVALPGGAAVQGATLPVRMGRSALTGAGYGAAYGAGEGETAEERATKGLTGAGFGLAAGAAAPVVMKGAEGAYNLGKAGLEKVLSPFRGATDPEAAAAKTIVEAAKKHFDDTGSPLSKEQIATLEDIGNPQAIIDLLGERGHAIARSAANTSPEAREILKNFIEPRFESQSQRAVDFVRTMVRTPANADETRTALAQADQYRSPFYQKAYADGAKGIIDDDLEAMVTAPVMKSALEDAAKSLLNKQASGKEVKPLSADGKPTLEFWDQVKRSLDSKYTVLKRQGDTEAAADVLAMKRSLVAKLDEAVPSYATARGVSAEIFKASDALEAGEKFLSIKMKNGDARKAFAKMNPEERMLFAEGYASNLVRKLEESADRRSILNHINSSPAARERMEIALGKKEADRFRTYLEVENVMDRARTAMGNSTTARQLSEMGILGTVGVAGGGPNLAAGDFSLQNIISGALLYKAGRIGGNLAQRHFASKASRNLAEQTARMLVSNDPAVLRKGIEALHRNKTFMSNARRFDGDLAKIAAQHPIGTGSVPVRADEDQQ